MAKVLNDIFNFFVPRSKPKNDINDIAMRVGLVLIAISLVITMILPLFTLIQRSFLNAEGDFVGLLNYIKYFTTPALIGSFFRSMFVALISTIVVVTFAFFYAYGLKRTCMPFKGFFHLISFVPILTPSLLSGISLIYLFGNQGLLKPILLGQSIYGPIGIIIASCYWTFPHALIILITALSLADLRLYEAAESLKSNKYRVFWVITLPSVKYGLVSSAIVVFIRVFTDFGVPKLIGGQYYVLATDIYKEVVGQQNFATGAVISVMLLIPAVIAFFIDRFFQSRQVSQLSSRAVPLNPKPNKTVDTSYFIFCGLIAIFIIGMLGMSQFAALIKFWPYNLSVSLQNYRFDMMQGAGWRAFTNSIKLSSWTAIIGTCVIFFGAYLYEKTSRFEFGKQVLNMLVLMPLAVPGMVLGLAYILFFNQPNNPLNFIYATMSIMVLNTIVHYYTVVHLTSVTALKQMDPEFESIAVSLKSPFYRTFAKVTAPVCLPTILNIAIYLFMAAMTSVSGLIFLYSGDTPIASISVLNMEDDGNIAGAAAMAMMIFYASTMARILHSLVSRFVLRHSQAWRSRT